MGLWGVGILGIPRAGALLALHPFSVGGLGVNLRKHFLYPLGRDNLYPSPLTVINPALMNRYFQTAHTGERADRVFQVLALGLKAGDP